MSNPIVLDHLEAKAVKLLVDIQCSRGVEQELARKALSEKDEELNAVRFLGQRIDNYLRSLSKEQSARKQGDD